MFAVFPGSNEPHRAGGSDQPGSGWVGRRQASFVYEHTRFETCLSDSHTIIVVVFFDFFSLATFFHSISGSSAARRTDWPCTFSATLWTWSMPSIHAEFPPRYFFPFIFHASFLSFALITRTLFCFFFFSFLLYLLPLKRHKTPGTRSYGVAFFLGIKLYVHSSAETTDGTLGLSFSEEWNACWRPGANKSTRNEKPVRSCSKLTFTIKKERSYLLCDARGKSSKHAKKSRTLFFPRPEDERYNGRQGCICSLITSLNKRDGAILKLEDNLWFSFFVDCKLQKPVRRGHHLLTTTLSLALDKAPLFRLQRKVCLQNQRTFCFHRRLLLQFPPSYPPIQHLHLGGKLLKRFRLILLEGRSVLKAKAHKKIAMAE